MDKFTYRLNSYLKKYWMPELLTQELIDNIDREKDDKKAITDAKEYDPEQIKRIMASPEYKAKSAQFDADVDEINQGYPKRKAAEAAKEKNKDKKKKKVTKDGEQLQKWADDDS